MSITAELDELLQSLETATLRAPALGQGGHLSPTQQVVAAYITHRLKERRADQEQLGILEREITAWLTGHRMVHLRNIVHTQVKRQRASATGSMLLDARRKAQAARKLLGRSPFCPSPAAGVDWRRLMTKACGL